MAEHRKGPRDLSLLAKLMVEIATGQVVDSPPTPEEQGKDPAAAAPGRKGGKTRAAHRPGRKRKSN
jgi:hypothetical protein